MLITKIEQQKKNKKRWSIFADGEFFCGLYEDTILKYGLKVNDETSGKKLNEIKDFDEYIFAKKTAFDYLSYRLRSFSEIKKKLISKKVSESTIEKVIKHLSDLGLLNDEEFARQLIQSKINKKPVGKKVLKQKLFEKGIDKQVSDKVLEKIYSESSEKEFALQNFKKYFPKIKSEDKRTQRKKTYEYLMRRGFDYDVINEIIRENIR
ncbi:MAG: RecX family transcriptional regulator [Ignavibacteria bacterium]